MNLLIFTTIVAVSTAAQLPSKSYIPPDTNSEAYGQDQQFQSSGGFDSGNRRPQQDAEKNAGILKQEQEISENGNYHFGFETSNGIRAEEAGGSESGQGGFSYKGDDGHTYTLIYTLGEGGFIPQGEHLPVAPPTPEAILQALQQNEKDEAAGIFDDGQYRPNEHGGSHVNTGLFTPSSSNQGAAGSSGQQTGSNSNTGYQY